MRTFPSTVTFAMKGGEFLFKNWTILGNALTNISAISSALSLARVLSVNSATPKAFTAKGAIHKNSGKIKLPFCPIRIG